MDDFHTIHKDKQWDQKAIRMIPHKHLKLFIINAIIHVVKLLLWKDILNLIYINMITVLHSLLYSDKHQN